MATFPNDRDKMEQVFCHNGTTMTATYEAVDNATGTRHVYREVTTSVSSGHVARIDPKGGSYLTPPPNTRIEANERIPTFKATHQGSDDGKKMSKSKYSNISRGLLGLRG